jgi:hypothetical protein
VAQSRARGSPTSPALQGGAGVDRLLVAAEEVADLDEVLETLRNRSTSLSDPVVHPQEQLLGALVLACQAQQVRRDHQRRRAAVA